MDREQLHREARWAASLCDRDTHPSLRSFIEDDVPALLDELAARDADLAARDQRIAALEELAEAVTAWAHADYSDTIADRQDARMALHAARGAYLNALSVLDSEETQ